MQPNVLIGEDTVNRVRDCKALGIKVDEFLAWGKHVDEIAKNVSSPIGAIKKLTDFLGHETLIHA